MWRPSFEQSLPDTVFLTEIIQRVERSDVLRARANVQIEAARKQEPLFAESLMAPQSAPHHLEGPYMEDHLRLMLISLYALLEGEMSVLEIEELRSLKGYEGELAELEEIIRENSAFFEVFILCHDVAKWMTTLFSSKPGSEGERLGFRKEEQPQGDVGAPERAALRQKYLVLFEAFSKKHPTLPAHMLMQEFYDAYGIQVHYYGHDRMIYSRVYRQLLERFGTAKRLPPRDILLLEGLIAHHLDPIGDFSKPNPAAIKRYVALADQWKVDADDMIDLLQGAVFLDMVCGSRKMENGRLVNDPTVLVHFLRSEHDYAPWRREQKEARREELRQREWNRLFRRVGLDGVALMDLLEMDPGPEFGEVLKSVQHAVVCGEAMPRFSSEVDQELAKRAARFYEERFAGGIKKRVT